MEKNIYLQPNHPLWNNFNQILKSKQFEFTKKGQIQTANIVVGTPIGKQLNYRIEVKHINKDQSTCDVFQIIDDVKEKNEIVPTTSGDSL